MEGHALAATGATPTLTANRSGCADIIFVVVNIPTCARQARARLQRALPRTCHRRRRKGGGTCQNFLTISKAGGAGALSVSPRSYRHSARGAGRAGVAGERRAR